MFLGLAARADDHHRGTGSTNPACAPALKATKQAAAALDQCVNSWKRDRKPGDHQPTDNCSGEMGNFTTAITNEGSSCTPAAGS
jgi:hypothetical protein